MQVWVALITVYKLFPEERKLAKGREKGNSSVALKTEQIKS